MMKTAIKQITFLLVIMICTLNRPAPAQTASSSLFPAQETYNPAAVYQREDSMAAFLYNNGSGKTETIVENGGYSYDTKETEEITVNRSSLIFSLIRINWSLEALYDITNENAIDNKTGSTSSVATGGNSYKTETTNAIVSIAFEWSDAINWGIRLQSSESVISDFNIVNKDTGLGLGVTYQFIEQLLLGLAGNYVMTEETGRVKNNWLELVYGVSWGLDLGTRTKLRLEYGIISSREDIAEASGSDAAHFHRASNDSRLAVELLYEQWKLAYRSKTIVVSPLSDVTTESEDKTEKISLGVAYHLTDSNYFIELFKHRGERKRGEYTTTTTDVLEINIGTTF